MRNLKTQLEELHEESEKMQKECKKVQENLKDGKSEFQKIKDSCNRGMWVAGSIALLCLGVVGLSIAHVIAAPVVSGYAITAGCIATVGFIGGKIRKDYYKDKIAKTDEVIDQIKKVEE